VLKNIKRALDTLHMKYIVHKAKKRHESLRIFSTPKVTLLRKHYLANTESLVKATLIRCGMDSRDPDLTKLVMSVVSALELDILEQSRIHVETRDGIISWRALKLEHDTNAAAMHAELLTMKPEPSTGAVLHADEFNDLISRWVDHIRHISDPNAMDETCPDDGNGLPYQHLEASRPELEESDPNLMPGLQESPPEFVRKCLGKPLNTEASRCVGILDEMRAEALAYLLSVLQSSYEAAKKKSKVHLSDQKLLLRFAQDQESRVLEKMSNEMFDMRDCPSDDKIQAVYCEQINKKANICGILAKFLKKVKKFHWWCQ
jgi:hypothetical protein